MFHHNRNWKPGIFKIAGLKNGLFLISGIPSMVNTVIIHRS